MIPIIRKLLLTFFVLLIGLIAVILYRAATISQPPIDVDPVEHAEIDSSSVVDRFSEALTYRTISPQEPEDFEPEVFLSFIDFVEDSYPNLHESLERELINDYSLLYTWEGSDPDKDPVMLIGHYDVVPVEPGTEDDWSYPAWDGTIAEGFFWGRGAIDDKSGVISTFEAIEHLIEEGFEPERTIMLGIGHDEEIGGLEGARKIAETLKERDIQIKYLIDEGMPIAEQIMEGIDSPVAMIGVAEKGYLSLRLNVRQSGGHSSMPANETSISILSDAINNIRQNPMDGDFSDLLRQTFRPITPELPFAERMVLSNIWLFSGLIESQFSNIPYINAALRTTFAPTIFDSGVKENVIPQSASAIANFRIHPMDDVESVKDHVRRKVDDDRVTVEEMPRARNPSPVTDYESEQYRILQTAIQEAFPDMPVAPIFFLAATDSRHYHDLTDHVFRFRPIRATPADQTRIHGTDERIGVSNYLEMIQFQIRLLKNSSQTD